MIVRLFLTFTLLLSAHSKATDYNFVSIVGLYEQQVGEIVLTELYKKLGIEISVQPMPGKRAILEAESGRMDGETMRIWSYGVEHPNTLRVPTPYYQLETMVFHIKDSDIKIKSKQDLEKYSVLKVRGVKHTNNITLGLNSVYDYDDTRSMLLALNKQRDNVALTHTGDGLFAMKKYNIKGIGHIAVPLSVQPLYHYVHHKNSHLIAPINRIIIAMKESGELKELIQLAEKEVFKKHGLKLNQE